VKRRTGLLGAVAGLAAAGAATGAVALGRTIANHRSVDISALADQPTDRSGRVVAADGVGLYYEELGPVDAPLTVLFAHGFCLQMGEFCFQRGALHEHFGHRVRLVFYDHRSHGRSDRSRSEASSIDQLGRDLDAVIDALVPRGPLVLVGHSMGGMTIMALADAHPDLFHRRTGRVAGVALISTSAGKMAAVTLGLPATLAKIKGPLLPILLRGARSQAGLVERGRARGSDVAWVITRALSFGSKDVDPVTIEYLTTMLASTRIEVIADFYDTLIDHDKLVALETFDGIPTQIICGDRDLLTPLEHSREIAVALPQAELVIVEKSGHMALMEHPEIVTEALTRLIDTALADTGITSADKRWWRRA
jgi:pimeloyl-ACP methyl ester carboxylesterase